MAINENLTELPKYWYCELTDESRDTLNNWRKNIIKYSDSDCPSKWICWAGQAAAPAAMGLGGEISFPQFKKWVLKEEPIAEKLPTVVELVAGEIYSFSWNGEHDYTFKKGIDKAIDKDSYYSFFIEPNYEQYKHFIRPATSEEKQWLETCISLNKFVTLEESKRLSTNNVEEKLKFEVGKFYQIETIYNWIVKCKSLNDNLLVPEWYYDMEDKSFNEDNGNWNLKWVKLIKELSLEEIQQYLPKGHKEIIMDKDELLAKAKRDYPIGTKIKSAYNNTILDITDDRFKWDEFRNWIHSNAVVYNQSKWAEIISKPEVKEIEHQQPIIYKKSKNKLKLITVNI